MSAFTMRCPHCQAELSRQISSDRREVMCAECRQWFTVEPNDGKDLPRFAWSQYLGLYVALGLGVLGVGGAVAFLVFLIQNVEKRDRTAIPPNVALPPGPVPIPQTVSDRPPEPGLPSAVYGSGETLPEEFFAASVPTPAPPPFEPDRPLYGRPALELRGGHTKFTRGVAYSPCGTRVASAGYDGSIRVWDLKAAKEVHVLPGHGGDYQMLAFSPNGRILAAGGSLDGCARLWDARTGNLLRTLKNDSYMVLSLLFSPDGRTITLGGNSSVITVWDVATGNLRGRMTQSAEWGWPMAQTPDGKTLITRGPDKTVRLIDRDTGVIEKTLDGGDSFLDSVAVSPDGKTLAAATSSQIQLYDLATRKKTQLFEDRLRGVKAVTFSPDGKFLAFGSGGVVLLQLPGGQRVPLRADDSVGGVESLAWSPDGRRLVTAGGRDHFARVWQLETGEGPPAAPPR